MSRSDATSKASLSTLGFRENRLRPAGILLDEVDWEAAPLPVVNLCRSFRNFSHTVPQDTPAVSMRPRIYAPYYSNTALTTQLTSRQHLAHFSYRGKAISRRGVQTGL